MKLSTKIMGLAIAGATLVAATAAVADGMPSRYRGPVVMPFSWTGFYLGVNAGYAWGDSNASSSFSCPAGAGCNFTNPINLAAFGSAASGDLSADGFTGGVQAGYNWQSGSAVLGVELDFNAFGINGSRGGAGPIPAVVAGNFASSASVDTDWLFTARARLGWTISPNLLLYATGGLAVTDVQVSNSFSSTPGGVVVTGASSRSDTLTGYAVGGGLEWAMNRNWSFKAEYLFVDFGSVSTTATVPVAGLNPNALATSVDLSAHIARVGINYKF